MRLPLTLGERLKALRVARGMDQKQLARAAKVSRPYLSQLENNKHPRPGGDVVARLADALEVTVDELRPKGRGVGLGEDIADVFRANGPRSSARDLDIYDGVGAATKLSDLEDAMSPMEQRPAPEGYDAEIGPNGIGVLVRGESMAGWQKRPIHHGDTAWLNPRDNRRVRGVVIAIVRESEDSEPKAVIKFHDGDGGLWSVPVDGARERFRVHELLDMAPVIVLTSPPGEP